MILRPGIQALLADARAGAVDVIVAEALDRLSRDQADVSALFKHLQFARVMIVTLAEGEVNELHVGLKGTMNALFLKDLAAKTHRGLRGRVEKGRSGGGLCYGYDVVATFDAAGEPARGERTINEVEAAVVRRVFREFASGVSPRTIARRLNAENIPLPLGQALDRFHHPGPDQARHRAHQQRALHRAPGLEPAPITSRTRRPASGSLGSTPGRIG